MFRWLRRWWRYSEAKALFIFWYKGVNSVKLLRQRCILVLGIIHALCFFDLFGFPETVLTYIFLWEISGPQLDKYQDYNEVDPDYKEDGSTK